MGTHGRARIDGDLLRRPDRGLLVAGLFLGVVAALTVLVLVDPSSPSVLDGIDRWWRDLVLGAPGWTETASHGLKALGSGWVMVPLRILVAVWLVARRRRYDLAAWLLAWVAADAITYVMKPGIGRLRPDGADATSFPSGHAKTAAQVAIGLVLVATGPWRSRATAWVLATAWIVAMAVSRTVLDEHWLSDVVAGSLLGAACAIGVAALIQRRRGAPNGRRAP